MVNSVFCQANEPSQWPDNLRRQIAESLFNNSSEGICITDPAGRIIEINPTLTTLTGYTKQDLAGKTPSIFSSEIQPPAYFAEMWKSLEEVGQWRGELWNRHKAGELYAIRLNISAICDETGKVTHYLGILADITAKKHLQAELEKSANHDALTGLPNRQLLADRLHQAIAQAKRTGMTLAVCYLDLDGFKPINDTLGHHAGDCVLIEVSKRLNESVRDGDTVSRVGGDEFIVLLLGLENLAECEQILTRITQSASAPISVENKDVSVTTSIGVAIYPDGSDDAQILIARADSAMYRSKMAGGNCWHFCP